MFTLPRVGLTSLLALFASAVLASAETVPAPDAYVAYRGATLLDGTSASPQPDMTILVQGERIERVFKAGAANLPAGTRIIDVSGFYVTAGLINSHEHLATPPNRPFAEAQMKKDLYGGITAVRDMADDLRQVGDLARASRTGEIKGPDIYYAALMAGPEFFKDPRTHAISFGAVAGQTPWMQAITPQTDLKIAVAEARGTSATAIKIYANLPGDLVKAITAEAHRQGTLVWAHAAVFPATPAEVIGAGVDSVSHTCMLAYQVSSVMPRAYHDRAPVEEARFAKGDNPVVEGLLQDMKRRGTILDATVRIYVELAESHAAHPTGPAPYCSADLAERLTGEAYRDGVDISTGTDGFSKASDPWPSLQDELELLQNKAGMKPADVIRSATVVGAKAVGQEKDMGTVQPGKLADLVFTQKDPLKDVSAYRTVVLTVKRGAPFWRKDYVPAPATGGDDDD